MAAKRLTLKEENARLKAELALLSDGAKLAEQLKRETSRADAMNARCERQIDEINRFEETLKHVEDGSWAEMENERREMAELLDCEPEDIVKTLKELRNDLGCDKGDTMLIRADELTSEAAGYEEMKKESEEATERADNYEAALSNAIEDRNALLHRLGMTDFQWSCQGGACETDMEVR